MFYIGIKFNGNSDAATFVLIEKALKHLKKHYHLKHIIRISSDTDFSEIENQIIRIYNDRKYITYKRVFSQDRRPSKTVRVNPSIVADFTGTDTSRIDRLRKHQIPIEGISLCHNRETWQKQDYGPICLGNNYFVPVHDLIKTLSDVFDEKRLMIEDKLSDAENLIKSLESLTLTDAENFLHNEYHDVISALSLPVWFCETIRFIKRY